MKHILAAILLLFMVSTYAQDKSDNLYVTAGPTLQGVNSEAGLGYYVGLRSELPAGDYFALGSLFNFLHQAYSVDDVDVSMSSMNASLFLQIKPVQAFSINGGYQAGVNTSLKIGDESAQSFERLRTGWLVGATLKAADRILIDAIFVRQTGDRVFDYTASVGVSYRL